MTKNTPMLDERQTAEMAALVAMQNAGMTEELNDALKRIEERTTVEGKTFIDKAVKNKMITYGEWTDWTQKYGVGYVEAESIFRCAYEAKATRNNIIILTVKYSNIWKMRTLLKRRFNVRTMTRREFVLNDWDRNPDHHEKISSQFKIKSRSQLDAFLKRGEAKLDVSR